MNKFITALVVLFALAGNAHATVGYTARACGFDMDDDGVVGDISGATEGPDCNVCDGVTPDPDGDGDTEDQVYVDCNSGVNSATACDGGTTHCGQPECPCRTISYAINATSGSANTDNRADGTGDGNEDIFCVRATCSLPNGSVIDSCTAGAQCATGTCSGGRCTSNSTAGAGLMLNISGVSGKGPDGGGLYTEKAPAGNEVYTYRYPSDPVMIVGWDTDNDGAYPPFDSTQPEPFIIDGCLSAEGCTSNSAPLGINIRGGSNVELAHFTIRSFAVNMPTSDTAYGGAIVFNATTGALTHNYLHDFVLDSIQTLSPTYTLHRVIGLDYSNATEDYFALENFRITNSAGWLMRGNFTFSDYLRLRQMQIDDVASLSGGGGVAKIWDLNHLEVIDSLFDGRLSDTGGGPQYGMWITPNADEVNLIGNTCIDTSPCFGLGYRPTGSGTSITNTYIRRNINYNTKTTGAKSAFLSVEAAQSDGQERSECDTTPCDDAAPTCSDDTVAGGNGDCACSEATRYVGRVEVTDNYFNATNNANAQNFVAYQNGSNCSAAGGAGPLVVANNTIIHNPGTGAKDAVIMLGRSLTTGGTNGCCDWDYKYHPGDVLIYNNIFGGMGTGDTVIANWKRGDDGLGPVSGTNYYGTGDFFADKNVYDSDALFKRGSDTTMALSAWKTATGEDDASFNTCTPTFEADGYSLLATDTCAVDRGNAPNCSTKDIELDPRPDGLACDIGADEFAIADDPCAGECVTAADCADGNVCTNDLCIGCPLACAYANNTAVCTDSLYCTGADTCSGGTCSVHAGSPCPGPDGDSDCTETCAEATDTCTADDTNGSSCTDSLYCTGADTCLSGACSTHDGDPCTLVTTDDDCTQSCNEATDTCVANDPVGSACVDGLFCTEPDACDGAGLCTGAALDCSASSTSCKTGTCDEPTDACVSGANKADGTACEDGTFCNGADECATGDCTTHAGDPCISTPNPLCVEATDICSSFTAGVGVRCVSCSCQGCSFE